MATQIVPFDPAKLATSLVRIAEGRVTLAALFMKMGKDGDWIFGVEGEEIEQGARFMVNPQGFQKGFIAWKYIPEGSKEKAEKLGEIMVAATDALEEPGEVPARAKKWDFQLGIHLKGLDDDTSTAGKDLVFRSTSVGGIRALSGLAEQVGTYYAKHGGGKVAVVTLSSTSYKHASYGKIYNPVIEIVEWIDTPQVVVKDEKKQPAKLPKKRR